jgi:hypothetical protein
MRYSNYLIPGVCDRDAAQGVVPAHAGPPPGGAFFVGSDAGKPRYRACFFDEEQQWRKRLPVRKIREVFAGMFTASA